MKIDLIGFDADDTLWHTEIHYTQAQDDFKRLLSPWGTTESIDQAINTCVIENLERYGYGIKALILSLVEAAIHISDSEIDAERIAQVLAIGKRMLAAEVVLRPHVVEALQDLTPAYRTMIITKGDLLDQSTKVKRSGIAHFFSMVEIVNDKTPETYAAILDKYHIAPENFLMVGNTIRSDIHPVLALGGTAVHIPAASTWEHEMIPGFDTAQDGFFHLENMGQLPDLIRRISNAL